MRERAAELATEWLGPRTELEIQQSLRREVDQERWTSLDRTLQQKAKAGWSISISPPMTHGTDSSAYCWSGVCNACSTWGWRTSHRPAWGRPSRCRTGSANDG
jgi:hypothetical protein